MLLSYKSILIRFGVFLALFYTLSGICTFQTVRNIHNQYFCSVGAVVVNVLNPHIHVKFIAEAPENPDGWDMSFFIYDKKKIGNKAAKNKCRREMQPSALLYQNLHHIILIPSLLLLCLIIVLPIHLRRKIISILFGLTTFYLFSGLYLSYVFELLLNNHNLKLDSIWHGLITVFGFGGQADGIYAIVCIIWGIILYYLYSKDKM